jgi:hypothetical protein
MNLYSPTSGTGVSAACFMGESNLNAEFKPYTKIVNTNYICTFDYAIIRLCDIFDSMKNMPLVKTLNIGLKLYINTGAVASAIGLSSTVCNFVTSGNNVVWSIMNPPMLGAKIGRDASGNPGWYIPNPENTQQYIQIA